MEGTHLWLVIMYFFPIRHPVNVISQKLAINHRAGAYCVAYERRVLWGC